MNHYLKYFFFHEITQLEIVINPFQFLFLIDLLGEGGN